MAGGPGSGLRGGLVAAEVATAFVLLVGAGLLFRSFGRLLDVDPRISDRQRAHGQGFASADEVRRASRAAPCLYERLLEKVRAMPGVEVAGVVSAGSAGGRTPENSFAVERAPPVARGAVQDAEVITASPGYFEALGIPLIRGRRLGTSDVAGSPGAVVINQEMARRYWKGRDPIGRPAHPRGPCRYRGAVVHRRRRRGRRPPPRPGGGGQAAALLSRGAVSGAGHGAHGADGGRSDAGGGCRPAVLSRSSTPTFRSRMCAR